MIDRAKTITFEGRAYLYDASLDQYVRRNAITGEVTAFINAEAVDAIKARDTPTETTRTE